jgi:hypothetical protein
MFHIVTEPAAVFKLVHEECWRPEGPGGIIQVESEKETGYAKRERVRGKNEIQVARAVASGYAAAG